MPETETDDWGGYRDPAPRDYRAGREVLDGAAVPAIAAAEPARVEGLELDQADDEWRSGPPRPRRGVLYFELAEEIRAEWARGGITQRELAARRCISVSTLKRVLAGRSYSSPSADQAPIRARRRRVKDTNPRVKLTRAVRDEIRRLAREEGWGSQRLAKRFKVAKHTIRRLLRGESWSGDHVRPVPPRSEPVPIALQAAPPPEPRRPRGRGGNNGMSLVDPRKRADARRMAREGIGARTIAQRLGVSRQAIRALLYGRTYRDDADAPPERLRPERWDP